MSRRRLGLAHHKVQVIGGLALLRGNIVEMATGEGKTLTTLLPAIAAALAGVPAHVATVNGYLATRDCETLHPVLEAFGLTVGLVTEAVEHGARPKAYAADVVFTTNKDVAFDYLRDPIAAREAGAAASSALAALAGRSLGGAAAGESRILTAGSALRSSMRRTRC